MKHAFFIFPLIVCASAKQLPVGAHPQRAEIVASLQSLVDDCAKEEVNHFFACRIGADDWIFWREGRLLLPTLFEAGVADEEVSVADIWKMRIRYCRKPIDLDSGVVRRRSDIGTSTYLVTQRFVSGIVHECVLNGELITLKKTPNKAPEPTTGTVTPRAPSSTSRASPGRGSS